MPGPHLLDEFFAAEVAKLIRRGSGGLPPMSAQTEKLLVRALCPHGAGLIAALGPVVHAEGAYVLYAAPASRCWPPGGETLADSRFGLNTVTFDPLTGAVEDANGRSAGFGWICTLAARMWRRPDDRVAPIGAANRILALIGLIYLRRRAEEVDREPWPGLFAVPVVGAGLTPEAVGTNQETEAEPAGEAQGDAVAAAIEVGISGDDIALLAAYAQHLAPVMKDIVANAGGSEVAGAELVVAFSRVADFLRGGRAERIAALLNASRGTDRQANVLDLAKAHRGRRRPSGGPRRS